jgi:hypothetical protein
MASLSSEGSQPAKETTTTPVTQEEKPLPKLTPSEFRQYNTMAEHMDCTPKSI